MGSGELSPYYLLVTLPPLPLAVTVAALMTARLSRLVFHSWASDPAASPLVSLCPPPPTTTTSVPTNPGLGPTLLAHGLLALSGPSHLSALAQEEATSQPVTVRLGTPGSNSAISSIFWERQMLYPLETATPPVLSLTLALYFKTERNPKRF